LRTRGWQEQSGVEFSVTEINLTLYNGTMTFLDNKVTAQVLRETGWDHQASYG
jgi:single-stranded DNA-binding protein